jgi:hypothetical protein
MVSFHHIDIDMTQGNVLAWLVSAGGWYDETALDLQDYPGMGQGAVALRDLEVWRMVCLHIPLSILTFSFIGRYSTLFRPVFFAIVGGALGLANPSIECRLEGFGGCWRLDSPHHVHDVGRRTR